MKCEQKEEFLNYLKLILMNLQRERKLNYEHCWNYIPCTCGIAHTYMVEKNC